MNYFVADGGYISWYYGCNPKGTFGWRYVKSNYSADQGCLIVVDGEANWRTTFYPEYKARRREGERTSTDRADKKDRVVQFTKGLLYDQTLSTIRLPLLEADDVIASLALFRLLSDPPLRVIGVDKDYAQLPALISRRTLNGTEPGEPVGKYPDFIFTATTAAQRRPDFWTLILSIMGDKSDGIPRLASKGQAGIAEYRTIMSSHDPYHRAYEYYGSDFLRNLYLVVLPAPLCLLPLLEPQEVMEECSRYPWGLRLGLNPQIRDLLSAACHNLRERSQQNAPGFTFLVI